MGKLKPRNINSVFELRGHNSNTGTETVTVESGFTVRKRTHTNEYYDETIPTKYMIYGKVLRDTPKIVATIKVEAESGKCFKNPPSLKTSNPNNIILSVKSVEKTNNNITSYILNLTYINSIETSVSSALFASLRYNCYTIYSRSVSVDNIKFGSTLVNANGERRKIDVYGHKDAVFALSINDDDDLSIIDSKETSSTITNNNGVSIPIIKRKIGKSGVYSFYQQFPSISKVKTFLNGAASSARTIVVDNGTGIKVGDKLLTPYISVGSNVTVEEINPAGGTDSINELYLSSVITAPNKTPIFFQRSLTFTISMLPDLSSTLGSNISTTYPGYTLYQYLDPTLTLKVSTAGTALTINGGSAGAEYYQYILGKANTKARVTRGNRGLSAATGTVGGGYTNYFKVTLNLAVVDTGSHTFTAARKPTFSNSVANIGQGSGIGTPSAGQADGGSDWTNTIADDNGGTDISINNISIGSTGSTTLSITYYVTINKWGNKDVTMELDLDRILTVGT